MIVCNEVRKSGIGVCALSEGMKREGLAKLLPGTICLLLHFCQGFHWAPLGEINFATGFVGLDLTWTEVYGPFGRACAAAYRPR